MSERVIRLKVNGQAREARAPVRKLLVDFLREDLGLTGTHAGCEHGVCGACTIVMDGEAVRSCLLFAVQAEGAQVATVESLADGERLHVLQQAFHECHAVQCGFCTAGILMSMLAFLAETPQPTEEQVRVALSGNLCRCTGYQNIVRAVLMAGARMVGK